MFFHYCLLDLSNRCSYNNHTLKREEGESVQPQYFVIDQKSYYATVECVARGLDPMKTNLVVADPERSQNTICYL